MTETKPQETKSQELSVGTNMPNTKYTAARQHVTSCISHDKQTAWRYYQGTALLAYVSSRFMSCALMHITSEMQQHFSSDYETIGVTGRPPNKRLLYYPH